MNTKRLVSILVLAVLALSVALYLGACGDKGGGGTSPDEAAAQASAVSGAVQLSETIGQATGMAEGTIPPGYAPGKGGAVDTSKIANIDPRLKDIVDKMMAQLQKPAVRNAASKVLSKTVSSSPLFGPTVTTNCSTSGYYTIDDTVTSDATSTTHSLSVSFSSCRDIISGGTSTVEEVLDGTLSAIHTIRSDGTGTAGVTANFTNTVYTDNVTTYIYELQGEFNSIDNLTSGTNSAKGSFTWTIPIGGGSIIYSFTLGSGNPVTDSWTDTVPGPGDGTVTHTGNGVFGYSLSMPGMQTITVNITLTDLVNSVTTSAGNEDVSISGRVSITWTPELPEYGCKSGTFDISTISPVHIPWMSCPTSGTVKINDATIQYGTPAPYGVTVTVGEESVTFSNCSLFEDKGGMCS